MNNNLVKEYFIPVLEALNICCGFGTFRDIKDCMAENPRFEAGVDEAALNDTLKALTALDYISEEEDKFVLKTEVNVASLNAGHLLHEANVLMVESKEFYEESEKSELKDILLEKLKKMEPYAFERLTARLLSALGFVSVKQQGGSGDGGRDVTAKYVINGIITKDVIVQCKRYSGSVPSPDMQKFKGTMADRNATGIFVTTGEFTKDARSEAERGTTTIQLIDGNKLVDLLLQTGIGVTKSTRTVYKIDVDAFIEKR